MTRGPIRTGLHPDLPPWFLHFTGRPRNLDQDPTPANVGATAEQRLAEILQGGIISAYPTFGTIGAVICVSEPTEFAVKTMLSTGVTSRGNYEPWAVILDREKLIEAGFRPVWYMSEAELAASRDLPPEMYDRRVKYEPGVVDWTTEREWRLCWGYVPGYEDPDAHLRLDIAGLVTGAIVGRPGWNPSDVLDGREVQHHEIRNPVTRLLWADGDLKPDGYLDLLDRRRLEDLGLI